MATANVFKSGPIVIAGSSAFNLDGGGTLQVNLGLQEIKAIAAGQVQPSFIATLLSQPVMSVTVTDLATMITGTIKETPLAIPTSTVYTGLTIFATKAADMGTIGGASTHFKFTIAKALIVLKSITCSITGHATASLDIHCLYDGTNAPITYTTGQSLPHTPIIDELFTIGSCAINGSLVTSVTNMQLDFGTRVEKKVSDGEIYPSYAYVSNIDPTMTLTLADASYLNTFALLGTAQGGTASICYFKKLATGGTGRVAAETAAHIKVTGGASLGLIYAESANLSPTSGEAQIKLCYTTSSTTHYPSLSVAAIT